MSIFDKDLWAGMIVLTGADFKNILEKEVLEVSKLGGLEKSTLSDDCRKIELGIEIRALYRLRDRFDHYYAALHRNYFSQPSQEFIEADFWDKYLCDFYIRCLGRRKDIIERLILDLMEVEFLGLGIIFPFRDSLKLESGTYLYLKGKKAFKKIQ